MRWDAQVAYEVLSLLSTFYWVMLRQQGLSKKLENKRPRFEASFNAFEQTVEIIVDHLRLALERLALTHVRRICVE